MPLTTKRRAELSRYFTDDELERFEFSEPSPEIDWNQRFREAYCALYQSFLGPYKAKTSPQSPLRISIPMPQSAFNIEQLVLHLIRGEEAGMISIEFLKERVEALHQYISNRIPSSPELLSEVYLVRPLLVLSGSSEHVPCRRAALAKLGHENKTYRVIIVHFVETHANFSFYQVSSSSKLLGAGYFEGDDHDIIHVKPQVSLRL